MQQKRKYVRSSAATQESNEKANARSNALLNLGLTLIARCRPKDFNHPSSIMIRLFRRQCYAMLCHANVQQKKQECSR